MKLKLPIKIVIVLLYFIPGISSAQETPGTPNELDKQFVPDKNSIFNSAGKTGDDQSSPSIEVKNIIIFNPAMLPRGIAAFYYQRRLTEQISLQGGLGGCFNKDRVLSFVSGITDDLSNNNSNKSSLALSKIMQNADFSDPTLFTSISFRLNWTSYFWDYTPYFEINARYYSNKLILSKISDSYSSYEQIYGTPDVIIRNTSFNLIYGFQFLTEGKIKTSHDFYMGIGMRNTSYDSFTSSTVPSTNGGTNTLYSKTAAREAVFAPSFIMGYAFGIGF